MDRRAIWLFIFVLLLSSCSGSGSQHSKKKRPFRRGGRAAAARFAETDSLRRRIPVEVMTLQRGAISSTIDYHTTVRTESSVEVYPLVSGVVADLLVEEGDQVQEGRELLALDDEQLRINLKKARLNLRRQEEELKQARELHAKNLLAEQEFQTSLFNFEQAQLEVETATLAVERSHIRAPIAGMIASREVKAGDYVTPSRRLFTIVDLSEPIAEARLSQVHYPRLRVGQNTEITCDLFPRQVFSGFVKRINPILDESTGTFKVTVGIHNPQSLLRPGMFINLRIILDVHENAVLVPKSALVYDGDRAAVFVLRNDTLAVKSYLELNYADSRVSEAVSGVTAGDRIVVVGQSALKDSSVVRVIREREQAF